MAKGYVQVNITINGVQSQAMLAKVRQRDDIHCLRKSVATKISNDCELPRFGGPVVNLPESIVCFMQSIPMQLILICFIELLCELTVS